MKKLSDNKLMHSLVEKYGLRDLFEKEMTPGFLKTALTTHFLKERVALSRNVKPRE